MRDAADIVDAAGMTLIRTLRGIGRTVLLGVSRRDGARRLDAAGMPTGLLRIGDHAAAVDLRHRIYFLRVSPCGSSCFNWACIIAISLLFVVRKQYQFGEVCLSAYAAFGAGRKRGRGLSDATLGRLSQGCRQGMAHREHHMRHLVKRHQALDAGERELGRAEGRGHADGIAVLARHLDQSAHGVANEAQ